MQRNTKFKRARNETFKRGISHVPGLQEARNVDWTELRKHSEARMQARQTELSILGERDVLGRRWPGSPCYNSKKIDYTFHRVLPALTYQKHKEFAHVWATTSPRWGNTKIKTAKFPAKEPWKFKQKQFYYRTRNGKRSRVRMGKR